MTIEPWPETARRRLAKLKVFDVFEAERRSPRTGRSHRFFLVDTWNWVNIVAFTPEDELLLVRQYRHGTREVTLEIPGGVVEPDEDPAMSAARELREETGYGAERVVRIGTVRPNPAFMTNRCGTYLAMGCEKEGEPTPDSGEDLEVVALPLDEVEARVRRGEIDHSLVLSGLYFYGLHRSAR